MAETYSQALSTVQSKRATANFHRLFINFAKFYEEGGTTGEAEKDLDSARKVLEKATKVNFKAVDELAEVWCEWAELEIRHEYADMFSGQCCSANPRSGTTTKPSGSCNVRQQFPRTQRSTIMITYVGHPCGISLALTARSLYQYKPASSTDCECGTNANPKAIQSRYS